MSVEGGSQGAGGGISTAVSTGVATGGFSAEIGGASAFSAPSFGESTPDLGGGFVPNMTMDSLFSNTTPFIASEGAFFDRPIGNPDTIFSQASDFSTLAKNTESPKVDLAPLAISKDLNEGQWATIEPSAKDMFADFKILEPVQPSADRKIDMDISSLDVVVKNKPQKENEQAEAVLPKIIEADLIQAQKVADILVSLGTEKEEAQRQVLDIVRTINAEEKNIGEIVLDSNLEEEQDLKVQEEADEETIIVGKSIAVSSIPEEEDEQDQEEDEEEKKKKKKKKNQNEKDKLIELALIVDAEAQASRKTSLSNRLRSAYSNAREKSMSVVLGKDVVAGLFEKKQDKSELLIQAGYDLVPDGSFDEVTDAISRAEFSNTSETDQDSATEEINSIIDGKPAVKISETITSRLVSKDDEKRVMKFVNKPLPIAT